MASRYVCGICGRTVATFESWVDVDPSDVLDLMTTELQSHNVNTTGMDATAVLSRFRIDDDDAAGGAVRDGDRVGQ